MKQCTTSCIRTFAAALLSLLLVTSGTANGSAEELRLTIERRMTLYDVAGLAAAKIEGGEIAWIEAFGVARPTEPVSQGTVFNVASLTKPMFATMVMHLVAEGRFELDSPLSDYWTDPDVASDPHHAKLTARMALSHQSGLPNWRGGQPLRFIFEPGTRVEYSGEGFEYVRRAVEAASGKSMRELMRIHVMEPAGMTETTFGWDQRLKARVATGYDEEAEPLNMDYLQDRSPNAAASTFTTGGDVAKFIAWIGRGADLPAEHFAEMTRVQALHEDPAEFFGLGWRVSAVAGNTLLSHDGREDGVRTQVFITPGQNEGLVILTNSSNGELMTRALVKATLANGDQVVAQQDREIWHFVRSQPPAAYAPMFSFIAKSPSFTAKLLYAAHAELLSSSGLPSGKLDDATAAIEDVALGLHRRVIDPQDVAAVFGQLTIANGDTVKAATGFDRETALNFVDALLKLADEN